MAELGFLPTVRIIKKTHVFKTLRKIHFNEVKENITKMGNKGKRKNKNERRQREDPRASYEDIVRRNKDFETYYKLQKICPEEEWDSFISTLQADLPTSFRITGSKSEAKVLLKIVQGQYFKDIVNERKEGDAFKEPVALPW